MLTIPDNHTQYAPIQAGGGALARAIRRKLADSSSIKPVELDELYRLGKVADVQGVLLAMLNANEVNTCQITRRGVLHSLWWQVGAIRELPKYGTGPIAR